MWLTGIISWPLGKLLDCILGGEHGSKRFNNHELRWLLKQHVTEALQATQLELKTEKSFGALSTSSDIEVPEPAYGPRGMTLTIEPDDRDRNASTSELETSVQYGLVRAQMRIFQGALTIQEKTMKHA